MPRQYTFKTTRRTEWMEGILNSVDSSDRSAFIREMIILGMKTSGIIDGVITSRSYFDDKNPVTVLPSSHLGLTKVAQKTHQSVPKATPEAPSIQMVEVEPEEVDLDSKLDSLYD